VGFQKIKNIIAVGSGKGGVGKSTVSVNLAVAVAQMGFKVGLMDADIYGPSQPTLLGKANEKPDMEEELKPIEAHGVKFMSMGLLVPKDGPVVWRAPMAMKIINQFVQNTAWGELDFLFIDMPPGTGDVQITLAQQASLTGSIVVTTPQDVALGVALKGLKMFQTVNVPIIGIVENMSGYVCEHCHKESQIFKSGGGATLAQKTGSPFLGAIPLDASIVDSGDAGLPLLIQKPDSSAAAAYKTLAKTFLAELKKSRESGDGLKPSKIEMDKDGRVVVFWPDNHAGVHTPYQLRINCTCAMCKDENTGEQVLDPKLVPLDIQVTGLEAVGRYGVAVHFSDGHNTGIYTFKRLRLLCECGDCDKSVKKPGAFAV
jgi:ATP-binding protein involved in chromosome partitioning